MITKSNYVVGHQCQRCFWFKYNKYQDPSEEDPQAQQRMRDGEYVGEEVKKTFPEGIEIPFLDGDYAKMCQLTKEAINTDIEVIFEGSFLVDGIFIRVDVMQRTPEGWDIFEVKSSSSLKPIHKEDASIQWHILKKVEDLKLKDMHLITLDKTYKRGKELQLEDVFKRYILTQYVESNQEQTNRTLKNLKMISKMDSPPKERISATPNAKSKCTFKDYCWPKGLEETNSIFKLYNLRSEKKFQLLDGGIETFEDIVDIDSYSEIQQIQINSTINNKPFLNKKIIDDFVSKLSYPISFFDFETFSEPIPRFKNQRPNERIPFQYSLHIQNTPNEDVNTKENHFEFLGDFKNDPRPDIAKSLIENIPKSGSIITYYKPFEKGVIKDLSNFCPDIKRELLGLNARIMDLMIPFAKGGYYHPEFDGSFSIKKVLPALCKDNDKLNYKNLNISNGGMASSAFRELRNKSGEEAKQVRKDLLKYCWLDTYAMYAIYSKLLLIIDT